MDEGRQWVVIDHINVLGIQLTEKEYTTQITRKNVSTEEARKL